MSVHPIRLFPDPILAKPCKPVEKFGADLRQLITDLTDTMASSPGVGLAAPQIGIPLQVSVIDISRARTKGPSSHNGFVILINPRLIEGHGIQNPREGCLSVPDLLGNVRRFETVLVETQSVRGESHVFRAHGFEALAFQHEIDHLHGMLFLDRVINLDTDIFRRKVK
ncbi:MAG: Peptide deformylase 1 [Elusimicrobia bacterium]|nr:Peptide deformylase 1 [Elusimicrobiota bacterium]